MAKGGGKGGQIGTTGQGGKKGLMTPADAARIQSRTAIATGTVTKQDFASRATRAADLNVNAGLVKAKSSS